MNDKTPASKPWYKKMRFVIPLIIVLVIVLVTAINGADESSESASEQEEITTTETTAEEVEETTTEEVEETTTEEEIEEPGTPNVAEGVDPNMGPQEWWDEYYRSKNCASQDMRYGGLPICMARGTGMANSDTMLVFYVDQDEPGVQEHFEMEARRQMFVDSLASLVMAGRAEGDERLNHVTDVRVIASGGEGLFSGWQGESSTS